MTRISDHPQRVAPPAPPGSRLKRPLAIGKRLALREATERDPVYLALVRQCPCLHCGLDPCGEAVHVRMASGAHGKASGMGKTPADKWALPLCGEHHREANDAQHKIGERAYWNGVGINPVLFCHGLYAKRGDQVAMRAVCLVAIAERESRLQSGAVAGD
jgi:hypothetical protein